MTFNSLERLERTFRLLTISLESDRDREARQRRPRDGSNNKAVAKAQKSV